MTEPLKRRTIANSEPTTSLRNGKIVRPKPSSNLSAPRKSSYGDYDSELVDGKYITSVPIISMSNHDDDFNSNSNLRWELSCEILDGFYRLKRLNMSLKMVLQSVSIIAL